MRKQKVVSGRSAASSAFVLSREGAGRKFGAFVLAMALWAQPCLAIPATVQAQGVSFIARRDFAVSIRPFSAAVGVDKCSIPVGSNAREQLCLGHLS